MLKGNYAALNAVQTGVIIESLKSFNLIYHDLHRDHYNVIIN